VGVATAELDVMGVVVLDQPGAGTAGVTLPKSSLARRTGGATQAKSAAMKGISENAFSVVGKNAQNSAPSNNDILNGRDRRCFFLVIIFIADVASSFNFGLPESNRHSFGCTSGVLSLRRASLEPTAATVGSFFCLAAQCPFFNFYGRVFAFSC
jgi:hypothetical protein